MSELQHIAVHVVIVGRGRVLADTTVSDLLAASPGEARARWRTPTSR